MCTVHMQSDQVCFGMPLERGAADQHTLLVAKCTVWLLAL